MEKTAYLVLENGTVFTGKSFGAEDSVIAEIVFTTGMTGYLETLTDPSYAGQIIVQTFPLIGNYGVIPQDFEGKSIKAKGYIVKHWCKDPSNFRCQGDLDSFLKEQKIPGLYDIDTRALVKMIREKGVMNGIITTNLDNVPKKLISSYKITEAVASVSVKQAYTEKAEKEKHHVVLLDFGLKENIKRCLLKRGCSVTVVPHNTKAKDIIALKPDGIMLSNGPGDPAENTEVIENLKDLIKTNIPIFGICLGHQLLALANGFKTFKLKYGHRGCNQPVKDTENGRVFITSQNHGYAVKSETIDTSKAKELFINVNDKTCEGIQYTNANAFSVQFHPEACGGLLDTSFLFDRFVNEIEGASHASK